MTDFTIRRLDFRPWGLAWRNNLSQPRALANDAFRGILSGEDQPLIVANDRILT